MGIIIYSDKMGEGIILKNDEPLMVNIKSETLAGEKLIVGRYSLTANVKVLLSVWELAAQKIN